MTAAGSDSPTALVTGASSGIGRAIAVHLARSGHRVALGYRTNADGARRTAAQASAETPGNYPAPLLVQMDLSEPEQAADAVRHVAAELGGLDVFVNNAGVNNRAPVVEETAANWRRVIDVDLTGPFLCAQAAAREMVKRGRGGRIVNVTSVHEHLPIRGGGAYCAAKSALGALTKVMALELAEHGITVNSVAPGETATPMNGVPENTEAATIERPGIPAGRPGSPNEVAAAVAHLVTPQAAYTTGTSVVIDGGLTLMAAIPNQHYAGRL